MVVKFTDLFETKYFYKTIGKDVSHVLKTCLRIQQEGYVPKAALNSVCSKVYDCFKVSAPVDFDLAGAVITSDVTPYINLYASYGLHFIDSTNAERNRLLQENVRRLAIDKSNFVPLPEFNLDTNTKDWIVSLRKDVTYLPGVNDKEIYVPLVIMATMLRPSIKFCLDNIGREFFTYIANRLPTYELHKYKEFYLVTNEEIRTVTFNPMGYVQKMGYVDLDTALTAALLVPTVVGTERIYDDPMFRSIFRDCNSQINRFKETRKPTLEEILK